MSKNFISGFLITFLLLLFAINSVFIVSETECAVLLRFGQIVKNDLNPGLHFKLPFVDKLKIFDKRLQTVELPSSRFLTQEKKSLIVDAYVKWRIENVDLFYKSTSGDILRANTLLSQRVESRLRNKIGSLTLTNVVSGQRDELMNDITSNIGKVSLETFGVNVIDVRVRQIDLPQTVSESVFSRMKSEREKEAREYRAQGREASDVIQANADKDKQIILAKAQKEADIVRGKADAKAAEIYAKAYNKDLKFYSFFKSLSVYKNVFASDGNFFILDSKNPLFDNFKPNEKK